MVAARLGANLVEQAIVQEAARRLEMSQEEVEAFETPPNSFLSRLLSALGTASVDFSLPPEVAAWSPPYSDPAFDPRKAYLNVVQELVKEAARTGNVVIVGHAAGFILGDQPNTLHVFLHADEQSRLAYAMYRFNVSEEEARKRMRRYDANRLEYVKQIYGKSLVDPRNYDLTIDTGKLGHGGAVEVIMCALRAKGLLAPDPEAPVD